MSDESNKDLSENFNASAQTEKVAQELASAIERFERALKAIKEVSGSKGIGGLAEIPFDIGLTIMKDICQGIVDNQACQDKKLAELESRIDMLEDGGRVRLLKKTNPNGSNDPK